MRTREYSNFPKSSFYKGITIRCCPRVSSCPQPICGEPAQPVKTALPRLYRGSLVQSLKRAGSGCKASRRASAAS